MPPNTPGWMRSATGRCWTHPAGIPVSIPAMFAAQTARDAVAVSCDGLAITYRQLDVAANRLAHLLADRGVARDSGWRCCFRGPPRRSWRFSRCSKPGRLTCRSTRRCRPLGCEFVLDDAAPIAAITTAELADRLDGHGLLVIDVERSCRRRPTRHRIAAAGPAPDDIAYLIYTSGTTGTPKGVAIPHHNVTRLLESLDAELELAGQVWTQCHSLAFDFSVWEIFGALLHGGGWWWCPTRWRAHRKTSTPCWSPNRSMCLSRPSAFYALQTADALSPERGQLKLEAVVFGGEALEPQRLRPWLHPGSPRLINMYGITETTVHASFRRSVRRRCRQHGQPDRGAVGPSRRCLCSMGWLRPVPAGVVGELYVAGPAWRMDMWAGRV